MFGCQFNTKSIVNESLDLIDWTFYLTTSISLNTYILLYERFPHKICEKYKVPNFEVFHQILRRMNVFATLQRDHW